MHLRSGSSGILTFNGKAGLVLRDKNPVWRPWKKISSPERYAFVSGGREPSDDGLLKTIVREIGEELCLDIAPERLALFDMAEPLPGVVSHTYSVELTAAEAKSIRLTEGQRFDFFTFAQIVELFQKGDVPFGLGGAAARLMRGKAAHIARLLKESAAKQSDRPKTHAA